MAANKENAVLFEENCTGKVLILCIVYIACERGERPTVKSHLIQIFLKFRKQKIDLSRLPFQKTPSECYDINTSHNHCARAHLSNKNAEPKMLIKGAEYISENFLLKIAIKIANNNTEYLQLALTSMPILTTSTNSTTPFRSLKTF